MKNWLGFLGCVVIIFIVIDVTWLFSFKKPLFARQYGNQYKGMIYDVYTCDELVIKMKWEKYKCPGDTGEEEDKGTLSPYNVVKVKNVTFTIDNITSTGGVISITDNNNKPYTYGDWYVIEQKIEGRWYTIEPKEKITWKQIGYKVSKGASLVLPINWNKYYGSLPNGDYRIIKQVDGRHIAANFRIEVYSVADIDVKKNNSLKNSYRVYLSQNKRVIYIANNIDEIYIIPSDFKMKLSDYITKSYQTFDDGINNITKLLDTAFVIRDGGSTVYRSTKYDMTLVKCNNLNGNKNIYIGDSKAEYDESFMCK